MIKKRAKKIRTPVTFHRPKALKSARKPKFPCITMQEWLESIEQRRIAPRPKGRKRAPKSLEQRRKISKAISAKWADPSYRERVCDALNKYRGILEGRERKPRRKPNADRNAARRKAYSESETDSKLEMIRNIRAHRAVTETKKTEVVERAKLLIAEAEKAAKALEVAATKSPLALASLMETRKLIAEETHSIQVAESGQISYVGTKKDSSSLDLNDDLLEDKTGEKDGNMPSPDQKEVNGTHI
ncbi:hypothetical protein MKX01_013929 [Papaver californicum]|nr:hypothetical protein MKX01_013929 [Papaver californicum]